MIRRDFLIGLAAAGTWIAAGKEQATKLSLLGKGFVPTTLGADAYFEVHGNPDGPNVFFAGPVFSRTPNPANVALQTRIKGGYIHRLGDRYRLLMTDYPHLAGKTRGPDETLLDVEDVCKDYLAFADAAGMKRFGAVGYSFGGNSVLQLATRSTRVSALAVGGWPAIDGPYKLLLETTQKILKESPGRAEVARYVHYYQTLQNWPERAEVVRLTCPKLNFIDVDDGDDTDFIGRLRRNKKELQSMGWETVEVHSGNGHAGGLMPEVAEPVIRSFLDKHTG